MAKITMNDYLNQFGLGESAGYNRKRAIKVAPKAFNPIAYAEAYAYVIQDGKRMKISANNLRKKCNALAAAGEKAGIVEAVKEGAKKVKDFLIKLYEKAVKFFTETVRYWMSNERKVAKVVAQLKAKGDLDFSNLKKGTKIKFKLHSVIAKLSGLTKSALKSSKEKATQQAWDTFLLDGIKNTGLINPQNGNFANFMGELYSLVSEGLDDIKKDSKNEEEVNAHFERAIEILSDKMEALNKTLTEGKDEDVELTPEILSTHYNSLVKGLIEVLEQMTSKDGKNMKAIFKEIETLKKKLKELKDSYKDKKDPSEAETLKYQKERKVIQLKIKWANMFNSIRDKMIGRLITFANQLMAQGRDAEKNA